MLRPTPGGRLNSPNQKPSRQSSSRTGRMVSKRNYQGSKSESETTKIHSKTLPAQEPTLETLSSPATWRESTSVSPSQETTNNWLSARWKPTRFQLQKSCQCLLPRAAPTRLLLLQTVSMETQAMDASGKIQTTQSHAPTTMQLSTRRTLGGKQISALRRLSPTWKSSPESMSTLWRTSRSPLATTPIHWKTQLVEKRILTSVPILLLSTAT